MFDKIFKRKNNKQQMWDILQDKPPSINELVDTIMDGNEEEAREIYRKILEARLREESNK